MTLTQMTPNARRDVIKHFIAEVQNNDVPREILAEWGLQLESDVTEFRGRVFDIESIFFGNNVTFKPSADRVADWSSAVAKNTSLRVVSIFIYYMFNNSKLIKYNYIFSLI